MRREHSAVAEELYPYFQDVYDHILRVSESSDSLRDLVSTIVETNLSLRDYRQNLIMKKVSSWAAIIAVPALITGYYGMNVPYPGSGETWGVVASTSLMAAACLGLYYTFRRRDWLYGDDGHARASPVDHPLTRAWSPTRRATRRCQP